MVTLNTMRVTSTDGSASWSVLLFLFFINKNCEATFFFLLSLLHRTREISPPYFVNAILLKEGYLHVVHRYHQYVEHNDPEDGVKDLRYAVHKGPCGGGEA